MDWHSRVKNDWKSQWAKKRIQEAEEKELKAIDQVKLNED